MEILGIPPEAPQLRVAAAMQQMSRRLRALEDFYTYTHDSVLDFISVNNLEHTGGRTLRNREKYFINGFDFNQGQNVIWDASKKEFVLIDL